MTNQYYMEIVPQEVSITTEKEAVVISTGAHKLCGRN